MSIPITDLHLRSNEFVQTHDRTSASIVYDLTIDPITVCSGEELSIEVFGFAICRAFHPTKPGLGIRFSYQRSKTKHTLYHELLPWRHAAKSSELTSFASSIPNRPSIPWVMRRPCNALAMQRCYSLSKQQRQVTRLQTDGIGQQRASVGPQ